MHNIQHQHNKGRWTGKKYRAICLISNQVIKGTKWTKNEIKMIRNKQSKN